MEFIQKRRVAKRNEIDHRPFWPTRALCATQSLLAEFLSSPFHTNNSHGQSVNEASARVRMDINSTISQQWQLASTFFCMHTCLPLPSICLSFSFLLMSTDGIFPPSVSLSPTFPSPTTNGPMHGIRPLPFSSCPGWRGALLSSYISFYHNARQSLALNSRLEVSWLGRAELGSFFLRNMEIVLG